MSEVGALIIRLQAETAQFREDMGKVKGDLNDLKGVSSDAGGAVDYSMTEARHSVMLLGEEFGIHLPRGITTFIASLGPIGAALEAAFPFLAIAVGATLLIEHLVKVQEQAEKLHDSQLELGAAAANSMTRWRDKLLEVQKAADDLAGNHLGALEKELQLIDHATMKDLVASLNQLAGEADKTFANLASHWYETGIGSEGAKAALMEFKLQYADLMSKGQKDDATNLLKGTEEAAERVKTALENFQSGKYRAAPDKGVMGDYTKYMEDMNVLRAAGLNVENQTSAAVKQELDSQNALLLVLRNQVDATKDAAEYQKQASANATQRTDNTIAGEQDKLYKAEAQSAKQAADDAEKAWEASYKEAVSNLQESEKEKIAATRGGTAERIAAIDAAIKEENSKGLQDTAFYKALLVERVNAVKQEADEEVKIGASKAKLMEALAKESASAELDSLKAQEAANNANRTLGLESDRQYYANKIALIKQEEEIKLAALRAEEAAEAAQADKAGKAGDIVAQNNALARQAQLQTQINTLTAQYRGELIGVQADAAKLSASWKNYFAQMKVETQDLSTQIRVTLQGSVNQFTRAFADDMARCIVENKNLGQAVKQEAGHMLESMISMLVQWLEKWIITHTLAKVVQTTTDMSGKATAASLAGANMTASWAAAPWPIDAMAPAMGAEAFAAAMSFEVGGKIPGQGAVPIIGHGGETVVTKALTDRVESSEGKGQSATKGGDTHIHYNDNSQHHAIDSEGMDKVLKKHRTTITRHIKDIVRKGNR